MTPLVALLLLPALTGSTAVLRDDPSPAPSLYAPGVIPRVDRNSVEGVHEWMDFIGTLRFAPVEGERGGPNRVALVASLG